MKTVTIYLIKLSTKLSFTIIANSEKIGYAVGYLIQPCKTCYKYNTNTSTTLWVLNLNRTYYFNQSLGLLLISIIALSFLSYSFFKQQDQLLAQQYIETIKYRDLVIDLDYGVKTSAQLTLPGIGKGPFPGVLLVPGSGVTDKNGTVGYVHKDGSNLTTAAPTPLLQIAQYLSERGFGVLRYDKRGVGTNNTILDPAIWINATANDLIKDSKKALNVLIKQPEIDPNRISVIGHSEGTMYAPRVAIDISTVVNNVILMGTLAQSCKRSILLSGSNFAIRVRKTSIRQK